MKGLESFRRPVVMLLAVIAVAAGGLVAQRLLAAGPAGKKAAPARSTLAPAPRAGEEIATLAGGCFWCVETQYEGMPGVRAETPEALTGALREALTHAGPVMIEVPVGPMPNYHRIVRERVAKQLAERLAPSHVLSSR